MSFSFLGLLFIFGLQGSLAAENGNKISEESYEPGIILPIGPGQALISTACTKCHDLKGLPAYKGYWNKQRWLSMIDIMIEHGAKLSIDERELVADYLTEHFGPKERSAL